MTGTYLEKLLITNTIRESTITSAIRRLHLPQGSRGLDAGCGAGLQCLMLAEEIGPEGHVTGLDISPEFLKHGTELIEEAEMTDRIDFQEGSIAAIPFKDNSFDWGWSADCIGYGPWEPLPLLRELIRVIRPGGIIAITAWSSERLLPGFSRLEARLGATAAGLAPFNNEMDSSRHFTRALGWFKELGLSDAKAAVFCGSVHAPLSEEAYQAMEVLFDMRWPGAERELCEGDLDQFRRLCKPDSPEFILRHPDYYAFFTYSMFFGTVPRQ